jgi:hypothetical protein
MPAIFIVTCVLIVCGPLQGIGSLYRKPEFLRIRCSSASAMASEEETLDRLGSVDVIGIVIDKVDFRILGDEVLLLPFFENTSIRRLKTRYIS